MKRILVTGATGFIGRHSLLPLLERGFEVHAVTSQIVLDHLPEVQWYRADLMDPGLVAALMEEVKPAYLLHFAWYAVPGKFWMAAENFQWVQASLALLQEFARVGGQRVVMAGTCAEYDWNYGYCVEHRTPLVPATSYGLCKKAMQELLQAFCRQLGLSGAWGRIFFLYGPYEHPSRLVASVTNTLLRGEPARCSHGNQIRDFLHVQDVAGAFAALTDSDAQGPVNIASGQPIVLKEVVHKIAELLNWPNLVELGALSTPADDPPLLVADTRLLHQEVEWTPQYDLESGLEQTVRWWQEQQNA
jgi:nucleoside-diphosphate-sugar epimerase